MFCAGFANEDTRIDKAGDDSVSLAIDDVRVFRGTLILGIGTCGKNLPVGDDDCSFFVYAARRIDNTGILKDGRAHAAPPSALRRGSSSASITAMRTATPISTCS